MKISICIPAYNSGEKLTRLLDSIKIQTYKNVEIIISDDSRNDDILQTLPLIYRSGQLVPDQTIAVKSGVHVSRRNTLSHFLLKLSRCKIDYAEF